MKATIESTNAIVTMKDHDGRPYKARVWRGVRLGCSLREICGVEKLARLVSLFAELSPEMRATLFGDKEFGA
jgi:hypothetical protein